MMWLYILNGKSRYDGVMPDISLWLEYYFRCQCRYYMAASESIIIIVIVPFMPSDVPSFVNLLAIGHFAAALYTLFTERLERHICPKVAIYNV